MDQFVVKGGERLHGVVKMSGAKNAALPIMAASLLSEGEVLVRNVPQVRDVKTMVELLEAIGVKVESGRGWVKLEAAGKIEVEAPYEIVKRMRASYYVLGPLVSRFKRARVSLPGGCAIGARPVDLHLKGLRDLGSEVEIRHGYIEAKTTGLRGRHIFLSGSKGPSVGATINVMMAATLARGTTVIEGAAREPEVVDCADFLVSMGARIKGAGSATMRIDGVRRLKGTSYRIIPDRIETGTYACAAAITRGEVDISGCAPHHLTAVIESLREAGVVVEVGKRSLSIGGVGRLRPINVRVSHYPGFPTDMQAQIMALMSIVPGTSLIHETIFENRFMHVSELVRMGARIRVEGSRAIVRGVRRLSGAPVMASDLRASVALVLAGLVAQGETRVSRVYHLDRGYEAFDDKMRRLGAQIERVSNSG